jgi:hypothetical protein
VFVDDEEVITASLSFAESALEKLQVEAKFPE